MNAVNKVREAAEFFAANHSTALKELGKEYGRGETVNINPYLIHVKDDWNCRDFNSPENLAHISQLAHSIKEVGVKQPITVYREGDKIFLEDGECRLRATKMAIEELGASIESIPAINTPKGSDDIDKLFSQQIRNQGKPFTALEQGNLFKKLLGFGVKVEEIARRSGLSVQHVNNLIEFQAAPVEIREMVVKGEVSQTLAQQVVRESKGDAAVAVETLSTGLVEAKKAGKNKVTAKVLNTKRTPATNVRTATPAKVTTREVTKSEEVGNAALLRLIADIWFNKATKELEEGTTIAVLHQADADFLDEHLAEFAAK